MLRLKRRPGSITAAQIPGLDPVRAETPCRAPDQYGSRHSLDEGGGGRALLASEQLDGSFQDFVAACLKTLHGGLYPDVGENAHALGELIGVADFIAA